MNCARVRRLAPLYLESELDAVAVSKLTEHLAGCPECPTRVAQEGRLESKLTAELLRGEPDDEALWARILQQVQEDSRAEPQLSSTALRKPWMQLGLAAAVAALVAAAFPWIWEPSAGGVGSWPESDPSARSRAHSQEILDAMKPTHFLGATVVVAVASAATTSYFVLPTEETAARSVGAPDPRAAQQSEQLAALTEKQAALEESLAELRALLEQRQPEVRRAEPLATSDLEELVTRLLEERESKAKPEATDEALREALADLFDPLLDKEEKAAIWERIRANGWIDSALAEFERRVERAPFDPLAHTELGWAYGHKMLSSGGGPEAGRWGQRMAASFERALELDPEHWDARYSLAQHFAYADLRGDAIRHFQVLIEQDSARPAEARQAGAYLWLGNLYLDQGKEAKAREVWSAGLARFPNDAVLRRRIESLDR